MQRTARCPGECPRILVEHGADVNTRNEKGETPLLRAARGGLPDTVRMLLDAGPDPDVKDGEGRGLEQLLDETLAWYRARELEQWRRG